MDGETQARIFGILLVGAAALLFAWTMRGVRPVRKLRLGVPWRMSIRPAPERLLPIMGLAIAALACAAIVQLALGAR